MSAIDTRQLIEMCGDGDGGTEVLREILVHVIRQNSERMSQARSALAADRRADLAQIAHAVKGSVALVGAQSLVDIVRRLEHEAATAPVDALTEAVAAMEAEFHEVVRDLHAQHPEALGGWGR